MAQSISQTKQDEKEWFDLVVENSISFLNSSVQNLELSPRNSIIDLYTAIELLFKARLMKEHWSLILAKPEEADFDKFQLGDFRTVYLSQAQKRLVKISKEEFDEAALDNFTKLGLHRNQIVHFAHTGFKDNTASVVIEVWSSWFYIFELLNNQWANCFSDFREKFNAVNVRVRKNIDYLSKVFDIKTEAIKTELEKGNEIVDCPSCTFRASVIYIDTTITQVAQMRPVNTWDPVLVPAKKCYCLVCNVEGYQILDR